MSRGAIVSTPNGPAPEGHLVNESDLEVHISVWGISDFRKRQYKVLGVGLKYSWVFYKGRRLEVSSYIFAFYVSRGWRT
jgi:hypothetical protein